MSENAALAAECVGGPLDGTLAVIHEEEFPVKISLAWNGRASIYRRRYRSSVNVDTVETRRIVYYEFCKSQPPPELE